MQTSLDLLSLPRSVSIFPYTLSMALACNKESVAKVKKRGVDYKWTKGTATITATAADGSKKKATCKVTVKNAPAAKPACQHNWKEVYVEKVVGSKTYCSCGEVFNTKAEHSAHATEAMWNGDTNPHSSSTQAVKESVFDHWECTKCGATKNNVL